MARTPTIPPRGVELSRLPTIRGREAAHEWIAETLGVPLTLNYVRAATSRRDIPCREIAGALMFATQDLFDWVLSITERTAS